MKYLNAIVLSCIFFGSSLGQAGQETCTEIKHLDFFGLRNIEFSWPMSEIDGLLISEHTKPLERTNFLIPMIVKQLADYRSVCSPSIDDARFEKLVFLYLQSRNYAPAKMSSHPIDEQLEFIVKDFYAQVEDDKLLPYMLSGFDDGPLKGELARTMPERAQIIKVKAKFGDLQIAAYKDRIYVGAFDMKGKRLWVRILRGTHSSRYLKRFDSSKISVSEYDAATVLTLITDGEKLTLFTRPNGRFVFYSHSW